MPDNTAMLKKLAELRKRRRDEKKTNALFQIDGNWSDLQQNFHDGYRQMLRQRAYSAECFHVLLNSLTDFYRRTSGEGCQEAHIQELVNTFLSKSFAKVFSDAGGRLFEGTHWEQSHSMTDALYMEKQRLECEVRCMVEIHLLKNFPIPLHQTTIVQKLRSLYYASDPVRMRKFLDETICDEFVDDLPLYLTSIYEELLLDLPPDLVEFQSMEGREDDKYSVKNPLTERNRFASQLEELFAMNDDDGGGGADGQENDTAAFSLKAPPDLASTSSSRSADEATTQLPAVVGAPVKDRRNAKRKREVLDPSYESPTEKLLLNNSAERTTARCRLVNVPETPEEKILQRNRRRSIASEVQDEVVEQTPIGKIKRGGRNEDSRLSKLLKGEEEKLRFSTSQQQQAAAGGLTSSNRLSSFTGGGTSKASGVSGTASAKKPAPRTAQRRLKL